MAKKRKDYIVPGRKPACKALRRDGAPDGYILWSAEGRSD